jgi:serine/threonine-protein kinase
MATPSGAKLLDFGVATMRDPGGEEDVTRTIEGAVIGTAAYMSPEQARGKPLDERSDIFSYGAVLYEMLSGKPAFEGDSIAGVLSAVIRDNPPAIDSPAWAIISLCLAKRPADRYQSMAEVRAALEKVGVKPDRPQQPSVAVLPFADMSAGRDHEWFSDGLSEEIINVLAQIPGLKVIARTSAFAFKGQNTDIRRIAEILGVTSILEGSVRRAGNRVRVTAQLISAEDGSHVFSERYDREMADVFAMQDEIAAAIATALRMKLSVQPGERRQYTPTLPAYEAVLKARHCFYELTPDAMARSREYLKEAIALDPGYALPEGELALHFALLAGLGMMPARQAMPQAREAARKALALNPSQPEALAALGSVAAHYDYDWKEAGRLFDLAAAQGQVSPRVRRYYGLYLHALGRAQDAVEEYERALSEDPLSQLSLVTLTSGLVAANRPEDAIKQCGRLRELDENAGMAWFFLSMASLLKGDVETAVSAGERAGALMPWNVQAQGFLAGLLTLAGDEARAALTLQKLGDGQGYGAPVGFVYYFLIRGKIGEAAYWAAKAIEQRWPVTIILRYPLAANLRRSPRWGDLARMMNLPA